MTSQSAQPAGVGRRFSVQFIEGAQPHVLKRGDVASLDREARALRHLRGSPHAASLIDRGAGWIATGVVVGTSRSLRTLTPHQATALGGALRELHQSARRATGWLPGWRSRVRSLDAYRRRRALDAARALPAGHPAGTQVVAASDRPVATEPWAPTPFRFLHGDLVEENILWTPAPVIVDWEFWRVGDPAEDLAYLIVVNDVPDRIASAILTGYGDRAVCSRVEAWRPICALDAGAWYLRHGDPVRGAQLVDQARREVG